MTRLDEALVERAIAAVDCATGGALTQDECRFYAETVLRATLPTSERVVVKCGQHPGIPATVTWHSRGGRRWTKMVFDAPLPLRDGSSTHSLSVLEERSIEEMADEAAKLASYEILAS